MRHDKAPLTVLLLLAMLAVIQLTHYYPLLPDTVAVHFAPDGEPDGWSEKGAFIVTYGATEAFIVLFGLVLAFIIAKIPPGLVNIPNREYWLTGERRAGTIEFLTGQVLWIEVATLGFLMAIAQLVFKANLGEGPPRFSGDFWYVLAAFVGLTVWFAVKILTRFRKSD